jgi:hypothetical protein
MIRTDFKGLGRALNRINDKISKMEDIATTRSLNIIVGQQRAEIARDVSAEYGVLKGSAKKHMKQIKATRVDKNAKLDISSTRTALPNPKKLAGKQGVSIRKKGGGQVKIKTKISGGSKPFIIKAKAGGQAGGDDIIIKGTSKKVAVFVPKELNKFTDIAQRKVKTLLGPTLAKMVGTLEIKSKDLARAVKEKFPKIYKEQLKKAQFTGSK